jgi:hypothetical protein
MNQRRAIVGAAAVAGLIALFLPTGWYDTIPHARPVPFSGAALLRLSFALEAIILAFVAARRISFDRHADLSYGVIPRRDAQSDIAPQAAFILLALITLAGLLLRTHSLGQDLWIDEISPIRDYGHMSVARVIGSYSSSNNHLLNTLLLKASISLFGESEATVRLPAVIFGTLTIPALYWISRLALSRAGSLAAALVLACSYHHVFFSQNARGYTAYILFALLSTAFLIRAMRDDRPADWAGYVVCAVMGSVSLLISGFVLISQAILAGVIAVRIRRKGGHAGPFILRTGAAIAIAAFVSFQVYASALPEVYVTINSVYAEPGTGYAPFSAEFFKEMARGISAGFGSPAIAIVFLAAGAFGYLTLLLVSWPLAIALTLPAILTATSLAIRSLTFSPRFFLLLLPLAILAAMSGIESVVRYLARKTARANRIPLIVQGASGVLLAVAAGKSLPYYYRTPKQPFTAALRLADGRFPGNPIVVVSNANDGFRYYVQRLGLKDRERFTYTRSDAEFDELTGGVGGEHPQVLTTFPRALHIELPRIEARLYTQWNADTTFRSTVGDAQITVWSRKSSTAAR